MSLEYKIISTKNDIMMKKKDTKYKIEFDTTINTYDKLLEIIKQQKFYELIYLLNTDIIEKFESNNITATKSDLL